MTSDTSQIVKKPPRASRGVRIALFASLALNALFVGGLVSAFVRHGGPNGPASPNAPNNIGAFVGTLPTERGSAVWKVAGEKRRALQPLRRQVRITRREVLAALTAEPFDREVFAAAQARLIEAEQKQRLAQRDIIVDIASSLTSEERRAYIRWRTPMRPGSGGEDDEPPQQPRK
jgi:uncharacterized membrane protein